MGLVNCLLRCHGIRIGASPPLSVPERRHGTELGYGRCYGP
jgi:hypothetical protein